MVFSSLNFMFVFLPIVLAVYYIVPQKWKNACLLLASLVFYSWGEPVYILLLIASILANYFIALAVQRQSENQNAKHPKAWLLVGILVNLLMLLFYKYFDLFARTLALIPALSAIKPLQLALPLGISFYTFRGMSYQIDVYRGDCKAEKNLLDYATYAALFPHLTAGPIVRYRDIAGQLTDRPKNADQFAEGVRRFSIGLAKKVLIANNLATLWDVYSTASAAELSTVGAWIGLCAYSLEIYFDFSGYSDMAIGAAKMFGFDFKENFDHPYISSSVTEFWRRWHISLGTWFRDYVYIPLGGNRKGKYRQLLNITIVWALTGFWHGASWNFMLWGLYYAVFLIIEKLWLLKRLAKAPRLVSHLYSIVVCFSGWILFELSDLSACGQYYKTMFGFGSGGAWQAVDGFYLKTFALVFLIAALGCTPLFSKLFHKLPKRAQSVLCPVLIVLTLVLCTGYLVDATYNPFIYFRRF
ncbi:MAG: MBOAT family O-acyltransferase [Oscillospiraceae bacterium]|jgi:alginate O-acetyltransferase complex protein AlgI